MRSRARNGFTFHRHIWFFLRAFSAVPHRMHDMAALGRKLKRGFILYGYTSWVVELVRQMEKLQLQLPLRSVMVAGEHLSGPDRAFIERITGVELYELYASRETGFLGYECHLHKMHVSEEWAFLEIVDAEGQPLPPGHEGRIIVTTFDNRVMPFIRYDIGDRGVISPNPCACGRTLRTLEFKGRTAELIELEDNRVVSLLDVAYAMGHMHDAVRQYQLVQTSAISFVIKIVPGPRFDTAKEELEQILVRLLHPRVQIEWEIVEDIPAAASGKAAYFVRDFKRTT
jgi:phenylacetate-CoA ligase